jgi:hypothetical protein
LDGAFISSSDIFSALIITYMDKKEKGGFVNSLPRMKFPSGAYGVVKGRRGREEWTRNGGS